LKVALNTIKPTKPSILSSFSTRNNNVFDWMEDLCY